MASSTRFAAATHILAFLAVDRSRPMTSQAIAASLATNPSVVRRLLGDLARAGLTTSRLGKGGGAMLARGPKKITMLDIYRAAAEPNLVSLHPRKAHTTCLVAQHIHTALVDVTARAEAAFHQSLDSVTLKDFVKSLKSVA